MAHLPEETLEIILRYCANIRDAFDVLDMDSDSESLESDSESVHVKPRMVFLGNNDRELLSHTLLSASAVSRAFRRISLPLVYEQVLVKLPEDYEPDSFGTTEADGISSLLLRERDLKMAELLDQDLEHIPDLTFVRCVVYCHAAY